MTTAHDDRVAEAYRAWQAASAERARWERSQLRCARCGMSEDAQHLVDVRVVTHEGEEGFADVTMLLCEDHLDGVIEVIVRLGFTDHRHGGADFLEDRHCPGYEDPPACPTPSEYGPVTVVGPAS